MPACAYDYNYNSCGLLFAITHRKYDMLKPDKFGSSDIITASVT